MHAMTPGQVRKVGELADLTGLTVRTLHHYDHIGLVCPSGRTASGHRLYHDADLQRLYQVVALRQLGLSLNDVAAVLVGETSMAEVLHAHRSYLDEQMAAMRRLRAQVSTLAATVEQSAQVSVPDFLELIRGVMEVDETVQEYFSQEQLTELAERRERVGERAVADVEAGWRNLLPRVSAAVESGMDPADPQAQAMAEEWAALLGQFHGGNAGLARSLYQMQAENADRIEQEYGGPSAAQLDFISRANAAQR